MVQVAYRAVCCCNHHQKDERTFPLITLGKVQILRSVATSGEELTDGQASGLSKHPAAAPNSQQRSQLSVSSYLGSAQSGQRLLLLSQNLRVQILSTTFAMDTFSPEFLYVLFHLFCVLPGISIQYTHDSEILGFSQNRH